MGGYENSFRLLSADQESTISATKDIVHQLRARFGSSSTLPDADVIELAERLGSMGALDRANTSPFTPSVAKADMDNRC